MKKLMGIFCVALVCIALASCGGASNKAAGQAMSNVLGTGGTVSTATQSRNVTETLMRAMGEVRQKAENEVFIRTMRGRREGRATLCSTISGTEVYTDTAKKLKVTTSCANGVVTAVVEWTEAVKYTCLNASGASNEYTVAQGSKSTVTFSDFEMTARINFPEFKYTVDMTVTGPDLKPEGSKFGGGFKFDLEALMAKVAELEAAQNNPSALADLICGVVTDWSITIDGSGTDCKGAMENYSVCT